MYPLEQTYKINADIKPDIPVYNKLTASNSMHPDERQGLMAHQQPKMTLRISCFRISEMVISNLLKNISGVLPKVFMKYQTEMAILKMSINCRVKTTRDI